MTMRIVSVLPAKVEERIAAFLAAGSTGCFELHVHRGEIKVCKLVTTVALED